MEFSILNIQLITIFLANPLHLIDGFSINAFVISYFGKSNQFFMN